METNAFYRRIDDLADRAERRGILTKTGFLASSEQEALKRYYHGDSMVLSGGAPDCERRIAFFLPSYMEPESLEIGEHISSVRIEARFGTPGHRDYMGAVLGLGIRREAVGDIRIFGETAYVFCVPAVQPLLLDELDRVGRIGVTVSPCAPEDVPAQVIRVKARSCTVRSLRLDAVTGQLFGLSRTSAADLIRLGAAKLNDFPCEKADAPVKEGDVISLRGHGKGRLKTIGARSKKDRIFIEVELYL